MIFWTLGGFLLVVVMAVGLSWGMDWFMLQQARKRARRLYERMERDRQVYVAYLRRLQAIHGQPGRN